MGVPQGPVALASEAVPAGMQHAHDAPVQPPPATVPQEQAEAVHHAPMGQPPAHAVQVQTPHAAPEPHIVAGGVPPAKSAALPLALLAGASDA